MNSPRLPAGLTREIAVATSTDPRSVSKEYRVPGSVRGIAGARIRRELDARGLTSIAPSVQQSA